MHGSNGGYSVYTFPTDDPFRADSSVTPCLLLGSYDAGRGLHEPRSAVARILDTMSKSLPPLPDDLVALCRADKIAFCARLLEVPTPAMQAFARTWKRHSENKARQEGLRPFIQWWRVVTENGSLSFGKAVSRDEVASNFREFAQFARYEPSLTDDSHELRWRLGSALRRLVPGITKTTIRRGKRHVAAYRFPDLESCRDFLEREFPDA